MPYQTLHPFCVAELEFAGQLRKTVPVADGEPGKELQFDFGRMGLLKDGPEGRRRLCWALIFTACYSRHLFCWLSFRQTLPEVIEGCDQAWRFFGGVFGVIIPDSLKAIVIEADPIAPRFNQAFLEYAQACRFEIDPARIRRPTDKPRMERVVNFVRESGFRGEDFRDLDDARRWMANWFRGVAGVRIQGTTQRRPLERCSSRRRSRSYCQAFAHRQHVSRTLIEPGAAVPTLGRVHAGEQQRHFPAAHAVDHPERTWHQDRFSIRLTGVP